MARLARQAYDPDLRARIADHWVEWFGYAFRLLGVEDSQLARLRAGQEVGCHAYELPDDVCATACSRYGVEPSAAVRITPSGAIELQWRVVSRLD